MILNHGLHLAYCTNVHPGGDWAQTFDSLNRYTLEVKQRLGCRGAYAIGLRLSDESSRQLSEPKRLVEFQRWLDQHECYVFTINGFPFGQFHGTRVKERVYLPDWTDPKRVEYTNRLFDLLSRLVPPEIDGSVSTLPGSFKEFIDSPAQEQAIRDNIWRCVEYIAKVSERTGRRFHFGLEPEPLCWLENSAETAQFFDRLRDEHPGDPRLDRHLGVNYDTCHFAVEFEEPQTALARLRDHGVKLSKIHISNALKIRPTNSALLQLADFQEDVYLHQSILRNQDGSLVRFRDLGDALTGAGAHGAATPADEWRVHFHIPLHSRPPGEFQSTSDHVIGVFELLEKQPELCSHLEMETYTWAVLPDALKSRSVTDQVVAEYKWTLARLGEHGFVPSGLKIAN